MPIVPINNVGEFGVIKATKPEESPPNAWTDAKNFRFVNGFAERFLGHVGAAGTPSIAPYHLLYAQSAVSAFWIYAGLTKVYVYDGTFHTDLTRLVGGDYTATADKNWVSTVLGGVPVLTNFNDVPQMWQPVSLAQELQDLTAWDPTWRCKSMRAYKQFLVALNISKSGVVFPHMVKWSHGAAAGNVPSSWNETDPTKDAGEFILADTSDELVDQHLLRDVNVLYKENTIWGMQFIGGAPVFRFFKMFETQGALSQNCATEFFSGLHVVFGNSDIITHNGQQAQSILKRRLRNSIYNRIDPDNYRRSFVVTNFARREIWFCFPEIGREFPNLALVWNFEDSTLGFRDIPQVAHMAYGVANEGAGGDQWVGDAEEWNLDVTSWEERLYNPAQRALYAAVPGSSKILRMDFGSQFDAAPFEAYVERERMGIPLRVNVPPDITQVKYATRVWPRVEASQGTIVNVYLKGHLEAGSGAIYGPPKQFVVGVNRFVDFRETGRTFSIKFAFNESADAKLHGYDIEVRRAGVH